MALRLEQLCPGDRLMYLHDSGAFGYKCCYATVVRLGTKKVLVQDEFGGSGWKYPWFFERKATEEEFKEVTAK